MTFEQNFACVAISIMVATATPLVATDQATAFTITAGDTTTPGTLSTNNTSTRQAGTDQPKNQVNGRTRSDQDTNSRVSRVNQPLLQTVLEAMAVTRILPSFSDLGKFEVAATTRISPSASDFSQLDEICLLQLADQPLAADQDREKGKPSAVDQDREKGKPSAVDQDREKGKPLAADEACEQLVGVGGIVGAAASKSTQLTSPWLLLPALALLVGGLSSRNSTSGGGDITLPGQTIDQNAQRLRWSYNSPFSVYQVGGNPPPRNGRASRQ